MIEMMDVFKIAGISLALMYINQILKQAGAEVAGNAISIVGFITVALIVVERIIEFFEVVETIFMF